MTGAREKMLADSDSTDFHNSCFSVFFLSVLFITAILLIYFLLPSSKKIAADKKSVSLENGVVTKEIDLDSDIQEYAGQKLAKETVSKENENKDNAFDTEKDVSYQNYLEEIAFDSSRREEDDGLYYYRQAMSRDSVEWFYFQITGNREVSRAILIEADKNEIPLSLAFALAFTESGYNVKAVNNNSNNTVDRGLFQLNSNSFPKLTEADFFDPFVSAKYGISHLRFCLNIAGNEVSALAMYNAGTGRVKANKTPQTTLNYVGKIMSYQSMLDKLFSEEVSSYYQAQLFPSFSVAYADSSK